MNFNFIQQFPDFKQLSTYCANAEKFVGTDYNISVSQARSACEYLVKFIYKSICGDIDGKTTFEMITDAQFIKFINDNDYINCLHYLRKMGNIAVHQGDITKKEALEVLENLQYIVGELFIMLGLIVDYPTFKDPTKQLEKVNEVKEADTPVIKEVIVESNVIAKFGEKMRYTKFSTKHKRDESENKRLFLSASLTDSGWAVVNKNNISMPCCAGINIVIDTQDTCDYILYGKDNKPLAIIEYTTTCNNLIDGRIKACEKADKLEKKYGYKPIVYYTNGYYIYCIDQLGYNPRRVFNFHTIDELEWLIFKKKNMKDITSPTINDDITNRPYQKESINAICNAFASFRRKSLLVLATGTGKTRVSISTVEILMKANWIKNVLFLADRTSLVKQAHKNFNKLLPNVTTSIYTGDSLDRDSNAKIIFSTYQSMMNLINEDTKEFSIGRFDLIIIDEAHRSIFKEYKAIFEYFDSLMLGLTATPRNEEDKSTYEVFELPNEEPDYAYELPEAIKDGFLVGFAVNDKTTDAIKRGIKYSDLSKEEKEKAEGLFTYENLNDSDHIKLDKKFINISTIDIMLNELMTNGIKINGGDVLGKTIIFAKSHIEAETIVERFQYLYQKIYSADFCKLIDSHVENRQDLIDKFEVRDGMPNIAVSVDMLDTGIDVPDILNLVFFKQVKSKIKFLQMIGRGTRLSPNIFGASEDKKGFLIFDYYDNFNYFSVGNTWSTIDGNKKRNTANGLSLNEIINNRKLNILQGLQYDKSLNSFEIKYLNEIKNNFINQVQSLVNDNILVQNNMVYVNKYRTPEKWDKITDNEMDEIRKKIIPLLNYNGDHHKIRVFDTLMLFIEESFKEGLRQGKNKEIIINSLSRTSAKLHKMIKKLLELKVIPEIANKSNLLEKMINCKIIYDQFSLENTENVRKELRDLMVYIPVDSDSLIGDISDFLLVDNEINVTSPYISYREKVNEYLSNVKNPILAKIMSLDELTKDEQNELEDQFTVKLGTKSDFNNIAKGLNILAFIRLQLGIDNQAIINKFGSFLNSNILNQQQLEFCNNIIEYTKLNGDFTAMLLQKVSPFCDVDIMNLFGAKFIYVKNLITGLHKPVEWKN